MYTRTEALIGKDAQGKLKRSSVIIFGIGGVGSYAAEAVARCGVGRITLVDDDEVGITNLNRQLVALRSTIGRKKTEVMKERIEDINPDAEVKAVNIFYSADTAEMIDFSEYDYVIDAVDTVTAKILIIERAKAAGTRVISSMGAGNKLHPEMFEIADVSKTSVCPLARVMRRELSKRGITGVKAVFSKEAPVTSGVRDGGGAIEGRSGKPKTIVPASIAFVPSAAGLVLAGEVIRELIGAV